MVRRLDNARGFVAEARAARKDGSPDTAQDKLDDAVLNAWRFAEYAINVLLELAGQKQERKHKHAERLDELRATGWLKSDYSKRLENLNLYRLKADYAGYSSAPSTG